MNLCEALEYGKPVCHKDMIGAYMVFWYDGKPHWIHRDNVRDFEDVNFLVQHCLGYPYLWGLETEDLLRDDWVCIDL